MIAMTAVMRLLAVLVLAQLAYSGLSARLHRMRHGRHRHHHQAGDDEFDQSARLATVVIPPDVASDWENVQLQYVTDMVKGGLSAEVPLENEYLDDLSLDDRMQCLNDDLHDLIAVTQAVQDPSAKDDEVTAVAVKHTMFMQQFLEFFQAAGGKVDIQSKITDLNNVANSQTTSSVSSAVMLQTIGVSFSTPNIASDPVFAKDPSFAGAVRAFFDTVKDSSKVKVPDALKSLLSLYTKGTVAVYQLLLQNLADGEQVNDQYVEDDPAVLLGLKDADSKDDDYSVPDEFEGAGPSVVPGFTIQQTQQTQQKFLEVGAESQVGAGPSTYQYAGVWWRSYKWDTTKEQKYSEIFYREMESLGDEKEEMEHLALQPGRIQKAVKIQNSIDPTLAKQLKNGNFRHFYSRMFALTMKILKDNGWLGGNSRNINYDLWDAVGGKLTGSLLPSTTAGAAMEAGLQNLRCFYVLWRGLPQKRDAGVSPQCNFNDAPRHFQNTAPKFQAINRFMDWASVTEPVTAKATLQNVIPKSSNRLFARDFVLDKPIVARSGECFELYQGVWTLSVSGTMTFSSTLANPNFWAWVPADQTKLSYFPKKGDTNFKATAFTDKNTFKHDQQITVDIAGRPYLCLGMGDGASVSRSASGKTLISSLDFSLTYTPPTDATNYFAVEGSIKSPLTVTNAWGVTDGVNTPKLLTPSIYMDDCQSIKPPKNPKDSTEVKVNTHYCMVYHASNVKLDVTVTSQAVGSLVGVLFYGDPAYIEVARTADLAFAFGEMLAPPPTEVKQLQQQQQDARQQQQQAQPMPGFQIQALANLKNPLVAQLGDDPDGVDDTDEIWTWNSPDGSFGAKIWKVDSTTRTIDFSAAANDGFRFAFLNTKAGTTATISTVNFKGYVYPDLEAVAKTTISQLALAWEALARHEETKAEWAGTKGWLAKDPSSLMGNGGKKPSWWQRRWNGYNLKRMKAIASGGQDQTEVVNEYKDVIRAKAPNTKLSSSWETLGFGNDRQKDILATASAGLKFQHWQAKTQPYSVADSHLEDFFYKLPLVTNTVGPAWSLFKYVSEKYTSHLEQFRRGRASFARALVELLKDTDTKTDVYRPFAWVLDMVIHVFFEYGLSVPLWNRLNPQLCSSPRTCLNAYIPDQCGDLASAIDKQLSIVDRMTFLTRKAFYLFYRNTARKVAQAGQWTDQCKDSVEQLVTGYFVNDWRITFANDPGFVPLRVLRANPPAAKKKDK